MKMTTHKAKLLKYSFNRLMETGRYDEQRLLDSVVWDAIETRLGREISYDEFHYIDDQLTDVFDDIESEYELEALLLELHNEYAMEVNA